MEAIIFLILYFVPYLIASARGTKNSVQVGLVNLLFGWTILGWLIALIMSASGNVWED